MSDLRTTDTVVVAIQNGKFPNIWYGLKCNPDNVLDNAVPLTVTNRTMQRPDDNEHLLWTITKVNGYYKLNQVINGTTYSLLNVTNVDWDIQSLYNATSNRNFTIQKYAYSSGSYAYIVWKADEKGNYFNVYSLSDGDPLPFDQIKPQRHLTSNAYSLNLYKGTWEAHFDGLGLGVPEYEVDYAALLGNRVILPKVTMTNPDYRFVGWASTPNAGSPDIGQPGLDYYMESDRTFYACYRSVHEDAIQCFDYTDVENPELCTHMSGTYMSGDVWWDKVPSTIYKIKRDPNEKDVTVPSLSVIPPGGTSSVKLGNEAPGFSVDRLVYHIMIDSTTNPILTIKWASVMQDPHHDVEGQPRFELEIKDEKGNPVNPDCGSFNFYSGHNTKDWKPYPQPDLIEGYWKDWTTLSVDLSEYHSLPLTIELTTYDCGGGEHFGYAYYSLACSAKRLQMDACGQFGDSTTLTAPEGFYYHWYTLDGKDLGTNRSTRVQINGDMYRCELATNEDGSCPLDLNVRVIPTFPVADFEAEIHRGLCADTVFLTDKSYTLGSDNSRGPVDNYLWNFGRNPNDIWTDPTPPDTLIYKSPGEHTISLAVGTGDWSCASDAMTFTFNVEAGLDFQHFYDTICLGESFQYAAMQVTPTQPGDYLYSYQVVDAPCLSPITVEHHLYVAPTYLFQEEHTVCLGETYDWHGRELIYPGIYYDSLTTVRGCDSIYQLTLTFRAELADHTNLFDTICYGETYMWNNEPYYETGAYVQHLSNQWGCDSVVTLNLFVRPAFGYTNNENPNYWDNPYMDSEHSDEDLGDDTNHKTTTTGHKPGSWNDPYVTRLPDRDSLCGGVGVLWHGKTFYEPGIYADTLSTIYGCDSIVYVEVANGPWSYSTIDTIVPYNQLPFTWFGNEYTQVGIYHDTLWNANARDCDSIGTLVLRTYYTDTITICSEDYAECVFNTEWGSFSVPTDCDSLTGCILMSADGECLVEATLCVNRVVPDTVREDTTLCYGTTIEWHGITIDRTQEYEFHEPFIRQLTCDSIVYFLNATIKDEPINHPLTAVACAGTSYTWTTYRDSIITAPGTYHDTLWTDHGCYSDTYVLTLTHNAHSFGDTTATACDAFTWHGTTYTESTDTATWTTTNAAGCDSVVTLHLTIYKSGAGEETKTICDKQLPYIWKEQSYTAAGDYTFDTLTVHGCDSVITLHLIVKDHAEHDTSAYICYQDLPFIWHGKEANDGDTIVRTNVAGCDSIVTLRLTISAAPKTLPIDTTVCDTLMPFTWRGHTYTQPDSYRETLYNKQGCDSVYCVYRLDTVHCARPLPPDPPEPVCVDSLVYRKWADVLFCDNGKHEFVSYQWYRDAVKMQGETKQYLYIKGGMGSSTYYVIATRADGSIVETCPLTFYERTASASTYGTVVAIPGRQGWLRVTIPDDEGQMTVWDVLGRLFMNETIYQEMEIDLPTTGTYIIRLHGDSGESIYKIINN